MRPIARNPLRRRSHGTPGAGSTTGGYNVRVVMPRKFAVRIDERQVRLHPLEREAGDAIGQRVIKLEPGLRVIPPQVDCRTRPQIGGVMHVLDAAPAVVRLVVKTEDHIEPGAHLARVSHQQRQLDQARWRWQTSGDGPPRSRHLDGVEVAGLQRRAEETVDRIDLDRLPRQHRDAVFAGQRLQHPRRNAIAAARGLHRRLHQQHALHGVLTSAVASASSDRIAVTPYNTSTVRRTDQPIASMR